MDDHQVQQLTEQISMTYFKKPFRHRAYFNSRLKTTGGRYLLNSHDIELNKKYLAEHGQKELEGIIKHELCHYHLHLEGKGYRHRDKDFRALLKEVGAPRFCTPLSAKKQTRNVRTYMCTSCGQTFLRKRSMDTNRYVCGKCGGKIKEMIKKG
ncbi:MULTISPECIES: SprT family protein [Bacillus]|uniref:Protein SprT-like n=1 Tax=Bacillus glycinifermentans TaxID=1664069 RepID=A0AAJ3YWE4_9BACI|nr:MULTISPECIES: SprT family protein [Bacillus]KKB72366.1 hypothetical protein TH62_17885 [Bacillus sp. TH008]MBU8788085.1 SprT family protein [Bacillus glycinifermentans]MDU0072722.1 SprT family protein [Bacillus sp. IG6]MED8020501.1 SprT family protein [Bacillus glycinifermentans]NUJ19477.1 SprT family protein [Bacillus glycinifermentans]